MKILIFFLTAIVAGSTKDVRQQNNHHLNSNAIIRQLFEMLKYVIKNGSTETDMPIYDPYRFDYTKFELSSTESVLSLHADFADGILSGIGNYQLLQAEFIRDKVAIDLSINFPAINFRSGLYKMEGAIYNSIPIIGMGTFEFEIRNFTFWGKTYLNQSIDGKSILIEKIINPSYTVQQVISRMEFDGNIDDIFNEVTSDLLAAYLQRFNKFIAKTYIQNVIGLMNSFLNRFESWRILATLL